MKNKRTIIRIAYLDEQRNAIIKQELPYGGGWEPQIGNLVYLGDPQKMYKIIDLKEETIENESNVIRWFDAIVKE